MIILATMMVYFELTLFFRDEDVNGPPQNTQTVEEVYQDDTPPMAGQPGPPQKHSPF